MALLCPPTTCATAVSGRLTLGTLILTLTLLVNPIISVNKVIGNCTPPDTGGMGGKYMTVIPQVGPP